MRIRTILYVINAIILPTIFQMTWSYIGSDEFNNPLENILLLILGCVLLAFIIELIIYIIKCIKSPSTASMLENIDRIGNQYRLSNGKVMFDVNDADYALLYADERTENKLSNRLKNSKHVIYHSLSAKAHLSWIEFIFWDFLRTVKQQLKCEIIVSLHYDEPSRETGLFHAKDVTRYNGLCTRLSEIARKIIGNDIRIIDEEVFHIKHSKFYAHQFHNIFVQRIITYMKEVSAGQINHSGFMRKLSYIESVFPIMVMTKQKNRRGRLYILDRVHAHEVWSKIPLSEYKNSHNIFFINAQTLTDSTGNPMRVYSPEESVNITDSIDLIKEKLSKMDIETKKTMCNLLKVNWDPSVNIENKSEAEIDVIAQLLFQKIKGKLDL